MLLRVSKSFKLLKLNLTTFLTSKTAPVKILQAHIGDLTLADSENDEFITKHIVGTKVEDLSQVYNGKVVIKGSLRLSNVILDSPKTNLVVNNEQFRLNVAESFWMKSVDQVRNLGNK